MPGALEGIKIVDCDTHFTEPADLWTANAPAGMLPGGLSYGRFLGAGVIVFTAFSGALNAGLPVMFDREFGFLNRLLVAPLRSRSSIVFASVLYLTVISLIQSVAIMATAALLGYGWPGGGGRGPGPLVSAVVKQGAAFTGRKLPVTIVPGELTEKDIEDLA